MLESAEQLSESSEKAKQTEAYQNAKEKTKENFDDLFRFLLGEKEIAGYTINDVKTRAHEQDLCRDERGGEKRCQPPGKGQ